MCEGLREGPIARGCGRGSELEQLGKKAEHTRGAGLRVCATVSNVHGANYSYRVDFFFQIQWYFVLYYF